MWTTSGICYESARKIIVGHLTQVLPLQLVDLRIEGYTAWRQVCPYFLPDGLHALGVSLF